MAFDDALNLFNFKNTPIYNYITAYPIVSKISMRSIISRSSISIGTPLQRRDPHCCNLCRLKYRSLTLVLYRLIPFNSVDIFSLATLIAPFHKIVIMIFWLSSSSNNYIIYKLLLFIITCKLHI